MKSASVAAVYRCYNTHWRISSRIALSISEFSHPFAFPWFMSLGPHSSRPSICQNACVTGPHDQTPLCSRPSLNPIFRGMYTRLFLGGWTGGVYCAPLVYPQLYLYTFGLCMSPDCPVQFNHDIFIVHHRWFLVVFGTIGACSCICSYDTACRKK